MATLTPEEIIENHFYLNMGASGGTKQVYRELKALGQAGPGSNPRITYQMVADTLKRQLTNQLLETNKVNRNDYDTISAKYRGHSYQFDLMDMSNLSIDNAYANGQDAYMFVALVQDVYAFATQRLPTPSLLMKI